MHKYNSLFFSVLIFFAACKGADTPTGIIKEEKMAALITEIHIADGSLYSVAQVPDSLYKYGTGKYLAIFKKFDTDSVQFKKSYKYYTSNPEMLASIYDQVVINLRLKTDSVNKANQAQITKNSKRVADSLKKLGQKPLGQPAIYMPKPNNISPAKPPKTNAIPIK
jgi:Domain of unknown function (DUF4296)